MSNPSTEAAIPKASIKAIALKNFKVIVSLKSGAQLSLIAGANVNTNGKGQF